MAASRARANALNLLRRRAFHHLHRSIEAFFASKGKSRESFFTELQAVSTSVVEALKRLKFVEPGMGGDLEDVREEEESKEEGGSQSEGEAKEEGKNSGRDTRNASGAAPRAASGAIICKNPHFLALEPPLQAAGGQLEPSTDPFVFPPEAAMALKLAINLAGTDGALQDDLLAAAIQRNAAPHAAALAAVWLRENRQVVAAWKSALNTSAAPAPDLRSAGPDQPSIAVEQPGALSGAIEGREASAHANGYFAVPLEVVIWEDSAAASSPSNRWISKGRLSGGGKSESAVPCYLIDCPAALEHMCELLEMEGARQKGRWLCLYSFSITWRFRIVPAAVSFVL